MPFRPLRELLRIAALWVIAWALVGAGLTALTTPGNVVAQAKPNAHPWFQPMAEGAKTTPSEGLSHYLSTRWAYTRRKPHVAICTRVTPIEIPPMVLGELVRGGWGADSIWIDPTCPFGTSEREAIAGAKRPYELVRITTFVIGWEATFIETIVEPADSPGASGIGPIASGSRWSTSICRRIASRCSGSPGHSIEGVGGGECGRTPMQRLAQHR